MLPYSNSILSCISAGWTQWNLSFPIRFYLYRSVLTWLYEREGGFSSHIQIACISLIHGMKENEERNKSPRARFESLQKTTTRMIARTADIYSYRWENNIGFKFQGGHRGSTNKLLCASVRNPKGVWFLNRWLILTGLGRILRLFQV